MNKKTGAGSIGNETTYFGPAIQSALAKFQKVHGITPAVGYFGPKTRAMLNAIGKSIQSRAASSAQSGSTTGFVFTRSLTLGSTGADISALQTFLKSHGFFAYPTITGYYGDVTFQAVAAYQKAHNLEPVGSVGPKTRALLDAAN